MKKHRVINILLIFVLLVSLLVGCNSTPKDESNQDNAIKDSIVVANMSDIISLDPSASNDTNTMIVLDVLYSRLYQYDENMQPIPDLVEELTNPSPLEWEIKIHENVQFHDGTELTSEDVKFTLERCRDDSAVAHLLVPISEIGIVDKYTVSITTKEAYPPLKSALSHPGMSIVSKAYVEAGGDFSNPIGTGPYKFVSRDIGSSIKVERFDDYHNNDDIAKIKEITFRIIPEGTSRTIALETGEVDVSTTFETIDYDRISDNSELKIYEKISPKSHYLGMNTEAEPFDNKLIRQAIHHAVNKESVLDVALNNHGELAFTVIPESTFGYVEKPIDYEYDLTKAKDLLAQAGYPDGFSTTIWASGDIHNRIAQVVQENLREIGIDAKIELFEKSVWVQRTSKGEQDMFIGQWTAMSEPDLVIPPLFGKAGLGANNRNLYTNEEVETLIVEGRKEFDVENRKEIYAQIQEIIMDDAPWCPLVYEVAISVVNADLKGVELNSKGIYRLNKLYY